ncbi:hypothetical protein R69658_08268 [Paraburkholderia aspalathi]|uniref:Uncharacterized protein n=1 Tax=Paraburkholderia aspalathi TaxID=1324617 RepID=A0ABM8T9P6_9BURK|nr:hypothetical protein R69658_08268 [Paraburkholderia aspalathi]
MRSFTFLNIPLSGCPGLLDHYTLTFFAAAKKDKQRKRPEAPAKWAPWFAWGSGATGIRALARSALVTKDSSAPTPHYVRRGRVCMGNHGLRLRSVNDKRSRWFYEQLFGARSAAGSMTPLSQADAAARTQIPVAPLPAADHGARLAGASSRFLLPTCIFPPVAPTRSVVATWTVSSSA